MSEYTLIENGFVDTGCLELFQQPAFFRMHAPIEGAYFELRHKERILACVHFAPVDENGTWRSPARGTFAGLSFSADLKFRELTRFFSDVESALRRKGAKKLVILPAPQAHGASAFALQVYLLRSAGFEIEQCDLNQSLEIDKRSLRERMSYGNLKRLKKCEREGWLAERLPLASLPQVYSTLTTNRNAKGYSLSMSLVQLQTMCTTFPEAVILFGCHKNEQLASAAVCLKLSPSVLYVFYWGDLPEWSAYSPVVPLSDAIYRFGQANGYGILDVGTSTIDADANFGLIEFKLGLGFSETLKLRLGKKL